MPTHASNPRLSEEEKIKKVQELFRERKEILEEICNLFEVIKQNRIVKLPSESQSGPCFRNSEQVQRACEEIVKYEKLLKRISRLVERLLCDLLKEREENDADAQQCRRLAQCAWQYEQRPRKVIKVAAVIARVFLQSPAYKADLHAGDFIIEFGCINAFNYCRDPEVFEQLAQRLQGERIPVKILRNRKILKKNLKPQEWRGCGLLGFTVDHCFADEQAVQ